MRTRCTDNRRSSTVRKGLECYEVSGSSTLRSMDPGAHGAHGAHAERRTSLNRTAFEATVHCLTGCAIGEVLGLAIARALGWHDVPSIVLAVLLAFMFG